MADWSDTRTSVTLLEMLRQDPGDAAAWDRFVRRYRPMICGWCREWGLQRADAEDVAQDVLAKLTERLRHFRYDRSRCFRAWLKTVARRAWNDRIARWYRAGDARIFHVLRALEIRDELRRRLEDSFDRELLEMAMLRVRERVAPPTWEAFRLTALEGLTGAEAAARLRVTVAFVFVSKHRVQKMLRQVVRDLGGDVGA
jgi:RNA polymerase sigma factor (sigma-70 family)